MVDATFNAESSLYVLIRWVQYLGLLLLIGAVVFDQLLLRSRACRALATVYVRFRDDAKRRAQRLESVGLVVLALSMALRLVAQAYSMNGGEGPLAEAAPMIPMLLQGSSWGRAWWLQFGATVLAAIGLVGAVHAAPTDGTTGIKRWLVRVRIAGAPVAAVATLLLAFTPAFASHAKSSPRFATAAVIADGLHVIGAGGWLGTLAVIIAAGFPAAFALGAMRGEAVAALVRAFSPIALCFAAVIAITGTFAAWLHLQSFDALWKSPYGHVLLWKLATLSLVAGTGAYNWKRVVPTLGTDHAAARVNRSARAELAIALVVVLITAILVATPTARMATM